MRLDAILRERFPAWDGMPRILRAGALVMVRWLTRIDDIDALLASHALKRGARFLDDFFDDLDFCCLVSICDQARIPPRGRLVIVANHPLGAMDALALLRAVLEVRSDVRVVVNELLMDVSSLAGHFLPLDVFSARPRKRHVMAMGRALEQEAALVIFPSGNVSRLTSEGLRDRPWFCGAVHLAYKHHAPVLPVFIGGRNSWFFYALACCSRTAAAFLLPRQIFRQRGRRLPLTIGDPIPADVLARSSLGPLAQIELLRQHVYQLGRHNKGVSIPGCASETASGASARSRGRRTRETNA
jgi:putative hemolysin